MLIHSSTTQPQLVCTSLGSHDGLRLAVIYLPLSLNTGMIGVNHHTSAYSGLSSYSEAQQHPLVFCVSLMWTLITYYFVCLLFFFLSFLHWQYKYLVSGSARSYLGGVSCLFKFLYCSIVFLFNKGTDFILYPTFLFCAVREANTEFFVYQASISYLGHIYPSPLVSFLQNVFFFFF